MRRKEYATMVDVLGWLLLMSLICFVIVMAQVKAREQMDTVHGLLNSVQCEN